MRGEKRKMKHGLPCARGSPPHARGKGGDTPEEAQVGRITPACAGKSQPKPRLISETQDHPRMRGEKSAYQAQVVAGKGSPPHARGKVRREKQADGETRITPACAGKS